MLLRYLCSISWPALVCWVNPLCRFNKPFSNKLLTSLDTWHFDFGQRTTEGEALKRHGQSKWRRFCDFSFLIFQQKHASATCVCCCYFLLSTRPGQGLSWFRTQWLMNKKKNGLRNSGIGEDSLSSGELFNLENKLLSINTAVTEFLLVASRAIHIRAARKKVQRKPLGF